MGSEGAHDGVQAVAGGVVEQNAYTHAAVGGTQQFVHQGAGAEAVVHDVVLQVDAGLGVADQFGAGAKCFVAVGQQAKAGLPAIRCRLAQHRAAEGRFAGGQGLAGFAWGTDAGTAGKAEQQHQQQRQGALGSQGWIVLCGKGCGGWTVAGGAKLRVGAFFIQ